MTSSAVDTKQQATLARLKSARFEATDKELLTLARGALKHYVDEVTSDPDLDAEDHDEFEHAVAPLETVFIEYRQHLRRRKIAKTSARLCNLLSPKLENEQRVIYALAALSDHTLSTSSLKTFTLRAVAQAMETWRKEWSTGERLIHRNELVAGIADCLIGEQHPTNTAAITKVLRPTGLTRRYYKKK